MIKLFAANKLVLNLGKTNLMKCVTNNSFHSALCIGYKDKCIEEKVNTEFCGLQIDNHLIWKNHLKQMIPKLSGAYIKFNTNLLAVFLFVTQCSNIFLP